MRYDSTDVPKDIPDNGTVDSVLEISEGGIIYDLDVVLSISHRLDADVDVYLVTPDGTRIELFTDVGGNASNFYGTVLDDEASASILDGTAPFIGRHRPEGDLSVVDGKNRLGLWKLIVSDDAELINGTLNSWALIFDSVSSTGGSTPPHPTNPDPADQATNVSVETMLTWGPPERAELPFQLLATTGSQGVEPFSLVELQTDPPAIVRQGDSCGAYPIDFSPDGDLYGGGYALYRLTTTDAGISCTTVGDFHTDTEDDILITGLAFHPDGTLYGVAFDFNTFDSVLYTIDENTAYATERLRIPIWDEVVWAIDFSSDGTLYGAYDRLLVVDYSSGQTWAICDANANDIDSAPDGSVYVTIDDTNIFQKIDISTGRVAAEYGPYESPLWGITSQNTADTNDTVNAFGASLSGRPSEQGLNAQSTPVFTETQYADMAAAIQARRELRAKLNELLAGRRKQKSPLRTGNAGISTSGAPAPTAQGQVRLADAAQWSGITYDVLLDTASPPKAIVCSGIDARTCNPGSLEHCKTYYWQVIARNAGGDTVAGPVWSFTTETVPADLDEDCDVDFDDLAIFMEYWGFGTK
jgi:subtilisin-like proprotein convertase family protein